MCNRLKLEARPGTHWKCLLKKFTKQACTKKYGTKNISASKILFQAPSWHSFILSSLILYKIRILFAIYYRWLIFDRILFIFIYSYFTFIFFYLLFLSFSLSFISNIYFQSSVIEQKKKDSHFFLYIRYSKKYVEAFGISNQNV